MHGIMSQVIIFQ